MASPANFGFARGGGRYDPNQPRVPAGDPSGHGGRWTEGSVTPVGASIRGEDPFDPDLAWSIVNLLTRIASRAAGPINVLRGILIPVNESHIVDGVLPRHPDVAFHYDEGVLALAQNLGNGKWREIFRGLPDQDGLYRLGDGAVIGRDVSKGVLFNEVAIGRRLGRSDARYEREGGISSRPKLCPDPVPDAPNNDRIDWLLYQHQITQMPIGWAVKVNGVRLDGCRGSDGVLLDAKGPRWQRFIEEDGSDWKSWYGKRDEIFKQMQAQSNAAPDRVIEWHVAEKRAADFFRALAETLPRRNIVVVETPYMTKPKVSP